MALPLWTEFFDDLQNIRGRSRNTVLAYRRDLELYEQFKETKAESNRFYDFMKDRDLSTRSQARVISSLRTYFRFLEKSGIKTPELREYKPPRVKARLPKPIRLDEFEKLLAACGADNREKTIRNRMTLYLLFGLGCRVSELINLNLQDFNATEGWLKVVGKGGKERIVPLTEALLGELKMYLQDVRPVLIRENGPTILVNDRGHRPSRVDVWRWLKAWSAKAGFDEPIGPHRFRHGCATSLLESGADLRSIQLLLGHSSIQTTQIYTNVTTKKLREEIDEHHPLSGVRDLDEI